MGRPLTARQQQVYDFIDERISLRGYGPTVREIGEALGIKSPNGVMCHLRALERKGMIHRMANKSRAIELANRKQRTKSALAVSGEIGQGDCILFDTPKACDALNMLDQPDRFLLSYNGGGLDDWSIASGDILVVQPASQGTGSALEVVRNQRGGIELQSPPLSMPQPHLAGRHLESTSNASAIIPPNAALTVVRNDQPEAAADTRPVVGIVVGLIRTQMMTRRLSDPRTCAASAVQLPLAGQSYKLCNWQ